ncbi:MAG TPA: ABC transporter substrate-binding protein [Dissulfurispiraceae bacterium]|nr:ABC transporter substrate-binding protein [Dissulfurispiraceae bacterium]
MAERNGMNHITRRNFLKIAGAAAGALSIPSALFALESARDGLPLKIGVVLPQSMQYPLMADNFMAGFGLRLDATSDICGRLQIVREENARPMPHASLKKLVERDKVDLAVCLANSSAASALDNYFPGTPMIVSNVGECMVREGDFNGTTFHCTLNQWQSNWAMGRWAARHLGKRVFIASSLFESGYDSIYSFRLGFKSLGGTVVETHVSHNGPGTENPAAVMSEIRGKSPDFVFALYSGRDAVDFVRAFASSGLAGRVPLAGVPFLVDEGILNEHGLSAGGIKSCFSWSAALPSIENRQFVAAYKGRTGRTPDAFAVLGFDTAGLIAAALKGSASISQFTDALAHADVISPRGPLKMDPATNTMSGPLYMREVRAGTKGPENAATERLEPVSDLDGRLRSMRVAVRTGWHNAYLCA